MLDVANHRSLERVFEVSVYQSPLPRSLVPILHHDVRLYVSSQRVFLSQTSDSRRIGKLSKTDDSPECPLIVIELDIPSAIPDASLATVNFLPDATKVDGTLICYDASDETSFRPVEALIRELPLFYICYTPFKRVYRWLWCSATPPGCGGMQV